MGTEYKYGPMELNMKENGGIIKHMEKEFFGMLMEMYTMENGKMTKRMVKGYIRILMAQNTMVLQIKIVFYCVFIF